MSSATALGSVGGIASINGEASSNQTLSVLVNGIETCVSANGAHVATINAVGAGGYSHSQPVAATTWTINHNLGYRPNVQIFTTGGVEVEADMLHTSLNQTVINFLLPLAGTARLV